MFQKVKVNPFQVDWNYVFHAAQYAAGFIHKQLELADKVLSFTTEGDKYTVKTSEGQKYLVVNAYFRFMLLLCRHILLSTWSTYALLL